MGILNFLKKNIAEPVKKGAEWLVDKGREVIITAGVMIQELGRKMSGPNINEAISSPKPSNNGGSSVSNEEYVKRQTLLEAEVIAEYQEEIKERAVQRESSVKNLYCEIYGRCISEFKEVFDEDVIKNLKGFIKSKKKIFKNTLSNEVNSKVNPSCKKWQRLISINASHSDIQSYCDRVYTVADNNLLDLLQEAIEDTNDYISKCIVKYNEDKALALANLKQSLINLTADEESNAKELKQIAEELAVVEFIANEVKPLE